jgi:hypothetical protein
MSFGQEVRDFANAFNSGVDSYANLERARSYRAKAGGGFNFKDYFLKHSGMGDQSSDEDTGGDNEDRGGDSDTGSGGIDTSAVLKPKVAAPSVQAAVNPGSTLVPSAVASIQPTTPSLNSNTGGPIEKFQAGGPVGTARFSDRVVGRGRLNPGLNRPLPPRPRMALPVTQMGNGMAVRPTGNITRGFAAGGAVDPNDMTNQYNTQLSPADEAKFQAWAKANPRMGNTYDYDSRGFWKSGAQQDVRGHGGDEYKKPNHPTFSDQSRYSTAQNPGGHWDPIPGSKNGGYNFYASPANTQYQSPEDLQRYFQKEEPNSRVAFPQRTKGYQEGGDVSDDPDQTPAEADENAPTRSMPLPAQGSAAAGTVAPTPAARASAATPDYPPSTDDSGYPGGGDDDEEANAGLLPETDEDGVDGNGRTRLGRALDGGIRWLSRQFGFDQGVPAGQTNPSGTAALLSGHFASDPASVHAAQRAVDPKGEMPRAMRMIRTFKAGYDYYMQQGDVAKANQYAAGLIQYTTGVAEQYGQDALDYFSTGNQQAGVQSLMRAGEDTLTPTHATNPRFHKNGNVTVDETDSETGRKVGEHTLSPSDLYSAALGFKNKSLAWNHMLRAAGSVKGADVPLSDEEQAALDDLNKQEGGTGTAPGTQPSQPGAVPTGGGTAAAPPASGAAPAAAPPPAAGGTPAPAAGGTPSPASPAAAIDTAPRAGDEGYQGPAPDEGQGPGATPPATQAVPTTPPAAATPPAKPATPPVTPPGKPAAAATPPTTPPGKQPPAGSYGNDGEEFPVGKTPLAVNSKGQKYWGGGKRDPNYAKPTQVPTELPSDTPQPVRDALKTIPAKYRRIAMAILYGEGSNLNPKAKGYGQNGNLVSAGLWQITANTWANLNNKTQIPIEDRGTDKDPRFDPLKNTQAFVKLLQQNERDLTKALHRPPTEAELAAAHQQGMGGFMKLYNAAQNTPNMLATDAGLSRDAIKNNLHMDPDTITAKDALTRIKNYYGGTDQAIGATPKPAVTPAGKPAAAAPAAKPLPPQRQPGEWDLPVKGGNALERGFNVRGVLPQDSTSAPQPPPQPQTFHLPPTTMSIGDPRKRQLIIDHVKQLNATAQKDYQDKRQAYLTDLKNWKEQGGMGPKPPNYGQATDLENKVSDFMGDPGSPNAGFRKVWQAAGPDGATLKDNWHELSDSEKSGVKDVMADIMLRNGVNVRKSAEMANLLMNVGSASDYQRYTIHATPGGAYRVVSNATGESFLVSKGMLGQIAAIRGSGVSRENYRAKQALEGTGGSKLGRLAGEAAYGTGRYLSHKAQGLARGIGEMGGALPTGDMASGMMTPPSG